MQQNYRGQSNYRGPRRFVKEAEHRINHLIKAYKVRVVGDNIPPGVFTIEQALKISAEQGLDLVEIVPNADPPVCRVIDYKKFLYEKKKKEKELKAKAAKTIVKEIRFTPNTDEHDLEFKCRHAEKFLSEGAKVKAYVQFKGRAITFKERGELLLLKFAERIAEKGIIEQMPKLEGKRMFLYVVPKTTKKK